MRGPDQLWLLSGSQSYLTKQWSICLLLAWNYCCRFKLGKFFASFPELLCTVCSLVKTAAVCCKGNCILMVDGDEPRMKKRRMHCQKGTTVSLFYQNLPAGEMRQTWELFKGKDGYPGEDISSSFRGKWDLLALVISYIPLPRPFGKLRKARVVIWTSDVSCLQNKAYQS